MIVFDIRYDQDFATFQPLKVKHEFSSLVNGVLRTTGYASVLTDKVSSIDNHGHRQFDKT